MFEYVNVDGFTRPTFEFVNGVRTTEPFGKSTPPANPPPPVRFTAIFEKVYGGFPFGFTTTTLADVYGTHTMFPFGVNTPPKNPVPILVFENVSAVGLY
jgi:hypothetical protein